MGSINRKMVQMNPFAGKKYGRRCRERICGHRGLRKRVGWTEKVAPTYIHNCMWNRAAGDPCVTQTAQPAPHNDLRGVPCRQDTHIQTHARLIHAADGRNQHNAVTQLSCSEKSKSRHTRRRPLLLKGTLQWLIFKLWYLCSCLDMLITLQQMVKSYTWSLIYEMITNFSTI